LTQHRGKVSPDGNIQVVLPERRWRLQFIAGKEAAVDFF
jgi:hypothetical protein